VDSHTPKRSQKQHVLNVLTDPKKVLQGRDPESLHFCLRCRCPFASVLSESESHQRQHHFKPRSIDLGPALVENFGAGSSPACEGQPGDRCFGENGEIRPVLQTALWWSKMMQLSPSCWASIEWPQSTYDK
jgi:hypothetical protein